MIRFISQRGATNGPIGELFDRRAPALRQHIGVHSIDACTTYVSTDTWIFTGLDQITPREYVRARQLEQKLIDVNAIVWNRPSRVMRRYELLEVLHDAGVNAFRPHRSLGALARFPVFIRSESGHGDQPTLLDVAPKRVPAGHFIVEFCDTRCQDGLYRKYSVLRLGEKYIKRHVLFSRQWIAKQQDVVTAETASEEEAFVASGDIHPTVISTFELSGIEYGRVDYSLLDGRPQIWEINLDPMLVPAPNRIHPLRRAAQEHSALTVIAALRTMACRGA